jgi:sterol desaturase/sphingolipid hydroxylase (fatty acid hydroxylase superfamily)
MRIKPDDSTLPDSQPRDARGEWRPPEAIRYAPILDWPMRIKASLKWTFGWPGYIWPENLFLFGLTAALWFFTQPAVAACANFEAGWIAQIYLRNLALIWIYYGIHHLYFYIFRCEGLRGKYNRKWPTENNARFMFRDQVWDNIFWSAGIGTLVWTAYEVLTMWLYANGKLPWISWATNPVWFVALFFLIPFWREFHFYWIHRLIHWKPLYKTVHYLHHKNTNPNPWSGLAMHPVELILYFSVVLIHWIVPSHPLHFLFNLVHTGVTPAHGHHGFHGPVANGKVPTGSYFHYLHHKHFECNYGESTIPLDRWFGTFRDGQPGGAGSKLPEEHV